MKLAWGSTVSAAFRAQVVAIAEEIGTDPSWLMAVMAFESRLNPRARNPVSKATGLIQFMPSTAQALGTTVDIILDMPAGEQLALVREYLLPYAGRLKTLSDLYLSVLWPKAIGAPADAVIFPPGSQALLQNSGLDIDHNGAVTKAEAASFVQRRLDEGMQPGNVYDGEIGSIAEAVAQPAPVQPGGSTPMDPLSIISIFGPIISQLIPQVGTLFGKTKDQPQMTAIQAILDTLVKVTQGTGASTTLATVGAAVDAMQADKKTQKAVTEAVVTHPEIIGALQITEIGAGGIGAARAANQAAASPPDGRWYVQLATPVFVMSIALSAMLIMVLGNVLGMPWGGAFQDWSENTRSNIVILIITAAVSAITGYWFGTTVASAKKDSIIAAQQQASASPSTSA